MIIIGVSGKKQSGKSTFVDYLCTKFPDSKVIRFADNLKQIILDCFVPPEWGWKTIDEFESNKNKNRILPCGKTVRQMLQLIGTDWFRNTWEDCWVNTYKKTLERETRREYFYPGDPSPEIIFTPDVRFPNEVKAIQEMGGYVIRLLRAPFAEQDQHSSETALDYLDEFHKKGKLNGNFVETFLGNTPGEVFNIILDNRDMTLEDTWKWIDNRFIECFEWEENPDGFSRNSFDPTKLIFPERK